MISKVLLLSLMISIIVIPTRLSKGEVRGGPRRIMSYYLFVCVAYYGALRFVVPRVL